MERREVKRGKIENGRWKMESEMGDRRGKMEAVKQDGRREMEDGSNGIDLFHEGVGRG
jgi:hypothetical protein